MKPRDTDPTNADCTDVVRCAWREIRIRLEEQKALLYEELKNYPSPITACDQQFNYLLETQASVARELAQLPQPVDGQAGQDSIEAVEAFLLTSRCVDADAARGIRSRLLVGTQVRQFRPIEIQGEPLSQTVNDERR